MNTYEVWLKKTYYVGFRIEAKTEEEAIHIACFEKDDDDCYGISNYEVDVDNIEVIAGDR